MQQTWIYSPKSHSTNIDQNGNAHEISLKSKANELRLSMKYWQSRVNAKTTTDKVLEGTCTMHGPLTQNVIDRINRYLKDPTECNWNACCSCIVVGGIFSLWQVWAEYDSSAPSVSLRSEKYVWNVLPHPEKLKEYLKESVIQNSRVNDWNLRESKTKLLRQYELIKETGYSLTADEDELYKTLNKMN